MVNPPTMTRGIATAAYIPIRKDPSSSSEMTSQLLFGEVFNILDSLAPAWLRIKNHFDDYEGWISRDAVTRLDTESSEILEQSQTFILNRRFAALKKESSQDELVIPAGSTLHIDGNEPSRVFAGQWYRIDSPLEPLPGDTPAGLQRLAGEWLSSPYIWGGKSTFGTDCSGLVQSLFASMGYSLKRDTSEQHKEGRTVNLLAESMAGDLVFFDNEEGVIMHVGVLLDPNHVLHASGQVRIDPIDHQGIYNETMGSYSHKLRLIKRIIN
jgi:cell wall-associated NlpC family hydrolase